MAAVRRDIGCPDKAANKWRPSVPAKLILQADQGVAYTCAVIRSVVLIGWGCATFKMAAAIQHDTQVAMVR